MIPSRAFATLYRTLPPTLMSFEIRLGDTEDASQEGRTLKEVQEAEASQ